MNLVLLVGTCCACGRPLRLHRDSLNRTISCAQLRDRALESRASHADETPGYPEVTNERLETIRRRLRPHLSEASR